MDRTPTGGFVGQKGHCSTLDREDLLKVGFWS